MRTITTEIYSFNELNGVAKARARDWYREAIEYDWGTEANDSLEAFCAEFGIALTGWSYGAFNQGNYINTNATPAHFRGLKLSAYDKEAMPTGYCVDSDLRYAFADTWHETGDAYQAFNAAIAAALRSIVADMEYQYSDEAVDESIRANEYEFDINGAPA